MSVLRYVSNKSSRFHTFIANRLAVIHEATDAQQWRYVDTKSNPADVASRGLTVTKLLQHQQWLNGPDFLWGPKSEWPQTMENLTLNPDDDVEVKKVVNVVTEPEEVHGIDRLLFHYSDWTRLKKAAGWMLTAIVNLQKRVANKKKLREQAEQSEPDPVKLKQKIEAALTKADQDVLLYGKIGVKSTYLTVDILQKAERALIRYVEHQHFEDEVKILQMDHGNSAAPRLKKSSDLYKLDPFLQDGLLRVGGRLERATIPYDAKHPIVLPKSSPLSKLIIEHTHKAIGHLGKNSILSVLRQKYWILGSQLNHKSHGFKVCDLQEVSGSSK